jgi:cyclic pyranopterin phosphate synthase
VAELSHFNAAGEAHMVDVGGTDATHRRAIAEGWIIMQPVTLEQIVAGWHFKGDVLGVARLAGIMAAKRTADLIPLCHPLALTRVVVDLEPVAERSAVHCQSTVETQGRTGVEMEALTAVQIALLTVYDMCKAVDRSMIMTDIRLLEQTGGKSGTWQASL